MRHVRVPVRLLVLLVSRLAHAEPTEPPPPSSTPPQPAAGPPQAVDEVVITGKRPEPKTPTEHRLSRDEMRVVPGAFGDPFRAIDILPSLVPIISGLPYYYVRGAPPSAVGYYVDGVRVPAASSPERRAIRRRSCTAKGTSGSSTPERTSRRRSRMGGRRSASAGVTPTPPASSRSSPPT